jgi:hypothetical protein
MKDSYNYTGPIARCSSFTGPGGRELAGEVRKAIATHGRVAQGPKGALAGKKYTHLPGGIVIETWVNPYGLHPIVMAKVYFPPHTIQPEVPLPNIVFVNGLDPVQRTLYRNSADVPWNTERNTKFFKNGPYNWRVHRPDRGDDPWDVVSWDRTSAYYRGQVLYTPESTYKRYILAASITEDGIFRALVDYFPYNLILVTRQLKVLPNGTFRVDKEVPATETVVAYPWSLGLGFDVQAAYCNDSANKCIVTITQKLRTSPEIWMSPLWVSSVTYRDSHWYRTAFYDFDLLTGVGTLVEVEGEHNREPGAIFINPPLHYEYTDTNKLAFLGYYRGNELGFVYLETKRVIKEVQVVYNTPPTYTRTDYYVDGNSTWRSWLVDDPIYHAMSEEVGNATCTAIPTEVNMPLNTSKTRNNRFFIKVSADHACTFAHDDWVQIQNIDTETGSARPIDTSVVEGCFGGPVYSMVYVLKGLVNATGMWVVLESEETLTCDYEYCITGLTAAIANYDAAVSSHWEWKSLSGTQGENPGEIWTDNWYSSPDLLNPRDNWGVYIRTGRTNFNHIRNHENNINEFNRFELEGDFNVSHVVCTEKYGQQHVTSSDLPIDNDDWTDRAYNYFLPQAMTDGYCGWSMDSDKPWAYERVHSFLHEFFKRREHTTSTNLWHKNPALLDTFGDIICSMSNAYGKRIFYPDAFDIYWSYGDLKAVCKTGGQPNNRLYDLHLIK